MIVGECEVADPGEEAGCFELFGEELRIQGLKRRSGSRVRNQSLQGSGIGYFMVKS